MNREELHAAVGEPILSTFARVGYLHEGLEYIALFGEASGFSVQMHNERISRFGSYEAADFFVGWALTQKLAYYDQDHDPQLTATGRDVLAYLQAHWLRTFGEEALP